MVVLRGVRFTAGDFDYCKGVTRGISLLARSDKSSALDSQAFVKA